VTKQWSETMTKNRIVLLGSAMIGAALLCGAGLANAQDYGRSYDSASYSRPYDSPSYSNDDRAAPLDDRVAPADETVIVHPYYDQVEKRQLLGRVDGEINPVELSISRPVSFSDLDLSREADTRELRDRIHDTATDLCAELDARAPELRGDRDADRECVRNATRNAMRDVLDRTG
jgi:UrcA family protein